MKFTIILGTICAAIYFDNVSSAVLDPIVDLPQGKLKGKLAESRNGRKFVKFLGIPYAQKPQRFQVSGKRCY